MPIAFNDIWLCHQSFVRYYIDMEMGMTSVERVKEYLEIEQEAPAIVEGKRPPAAVSYIAQEPFYLRSVCAHLCCVPNG